MPILTREERAVIEPLAQLTFTNPFLPERIALERRILGDDYRATAGGAWSWERDAPAVHNFQRIERRIESLAQTVRERLAKGQRGDDREYELYDDVVIHLLFFRLDQIWQSDEASDAARVVATWPTFLDDFRFFLDGVDVAFPSRANPEHVFAGIYQIHRAFQNIFHSVIGRSAAAIRLRSSIWQSIFTHDIRRYRRSLYQHMSQFATLIAGPSGTGKELVASAIGRSQYCPFDSRKRQFASDPGQDFFPLHLAALPATLVESELFGHAKDSFTGANRDRVGWLETVGPHGAVFLDEVSEIDLAVQVKLLRVLQTRQFHRIGQQVPRRFAGKLVAATNRDLKREIARGTFRQDLYFRLCGDLIHTPSLREQLRDTPEDLDQSIRFIAEQLVPYDVDSVAHDVVRWIAKNLPEDYPWPGNFRELEQCVRNVIVRNHYELADERPTATGPLSTTAAEMERLALGADELLRRYCTYAYWKTKSYENAAENLKLDRRTVRAKLDETFLSQLGTPQPGA